LISLLKILSNMHCKFFFFFNFFFISLKIIIFLIRAQRNWLEMTKVMVLV
jgi:hypothetical protein